VEYLRGWAVIDSLTSSRVPKGGEYAIEAVTGGEKKAGPETLPTVLVVDDDEDIREVTALVLGDLGFRTARAGGGEEALRLVRSDDSIAVMVTDVIMPGMNGFELAEQALRLRPEMELIFVSGYTARLDPGNFGATDRVGFLRKPFRIPQLQALILDLLRRPRGGVMMMLASIGLAALASS
jgi:CheY-like chemotaxis protein